MEAVFLQPMFVTQKKIAKMVRMRWIVSQVRNYGPHWMVLIGVYIIETFLGQKQQDCQENDGTNIANVGARTTIICSNKKDDGKKQNDQTTTTTMTPSTSTSPQTSGI